MANWSPFPAHVFNGSAVPYNMNLPNVGRPIYAPGPDPFRIIGTMPPNGMSPFPQPQPPMPNSWQGNPNALPPQWAPGDNTPYLQPVNSPAHNLSLGLGGPIQPDPRMFLQPPPNDVGPDPTSGLDNTHPQAGIPNLNQGWSQGNLNSPFGQQRRGPVRMRSFDQGGWPSANDSSDSDSDVDNRLALVPWAPPSPHGGKHTPLYTRPSDMVNLPVSQRHAQKHFTMSRPPNVRRPLHRPSRGGEASPQDSLILVASRPLEWRPDYSPRRGSGLKRGLSRVRTAINSRGSLYTLNPLILYDADAYPLYHDIRHEPEVVDIIFLNLQRESNQLDLYQLATTPPVHEMCLWHPRLPWYVKIEASHANGVTLMDIFTQMYDQLHEGITSNHYYNILLTSADREEIATAFMQRTHGFPVLRSKGIMRIDFMCTDIVFVGLSKSKDGMWKIKTRQPDNF